MKFVAVVDMRGRIINEGAGVKGASAGMGLREGEMKLVSAGGEKGCGGRGVLIVG